MTYEEAKQRLATEGKIDVKDSFAIAHACSCLLGKAETELRGRDLVIRALDVWGKFPEATRKLWNDLIEVAGLYPYLDEKLLTGAGLLRNEYHRSSNLGFTFHDEQLALSLLLKSGKSLILSAPTSFGKSLLIEEVVASRKYKNIVVIQPTLALLDETRKKLQKYKDEYQIIVATTQKPSPDKNIFLFTGERVDEYAHFPIIDFFVLDEFYKLSLERDDDRAASLNSAIYRLLKMTKNFYMLGPSIFQIPEGFAAKFGAHWHKTDFATVAADVKTVVDKKAKVAEKEQNLYKLLNDQKDPTLIYCAAPGRVKKLAEGFLTYLENNGAKANDTNAELVTWIRENIHNDWMLCKTLSFGIGLHHGNLPRHLTSSIVEAFNDGKIKYLFCTSTLIEGVNTSAKNVVLFDKKKGKKPIDYFDFKNIAGRSGRMKKHFVGTIYQFDKEPEQFDLSIDIPFFTQEDAPPELLIQLEPADLKPESTKKISEFNELNSSMKEVIKSNKGVSVDGQTKIINLILANPEYYHPLLCWTGLPKYEQLSMVIHLAWDHLLKAEEKRGVTTAKQLTYMTMQYSVRKSLKALISDEITNQLKRNPTGDRAEIIQDSIDKILSLDQKWFGYKLPKLLSVVSNLQKYAFEKMGKRAGDYSFYSSQIENSFLPQNLSLLLQFGIPASAIRKLSRVITEELSYQDLIARIKHIDLANLGMNLYEISKLKHL